MKKNTTITLLIMIASIFVSISGCNKAHNNVNDPSSTNASNNESTTTPASQNINESTSTPVPQSIIESTTTPIPSNVNESTPSPVTSYQNYMGTWNTGSEYEEELTIWETNNTYQLVIGVYRITTLYATAEKESGNRLEFYTTDARSITGTLEFKVNSILVTIIDSDFKYIEAGTTYDFTNQISHDNSLETINLAIECDENLCTADEIVLFSFKVEDSQKVLSICEEKNKSYIVYRYGTKDNIELEYPEDKTDYLGFSYTDADDYPDDASDVDLTKYLSFTNKGYYYTIREYKSETMKQLEADILITDLFTGEVVTTNRAQSGSIIGDLLYIKDYLNDAR